MLRNGCLHCVGGTVQFTPGRAGCIQCGWELLGDGILPQNAGVV